MYSQTIETVCGSLIRPYYNGSAYMCAWKHSLTCSTEVVGHALRITVTGDEDEVERFVAAWRYVHGFVVSERRRD